MHVTSFLLAVGFTILPSMKQHLAKNCVSTANYNISGKKHFVFIFSVLIFYICYISFYMLISPGSKYLNIFNDTNATSEKFFLVFCFACSY